MSQEGRVTSRADTDPDAIAKLFKFEERFYRLLRK